MNSGRQLRRLRRLCAAIGEFEERLSHGAPTFFARKKVFAMFSNNHHDDGHLAVLIPVPSGLQRALIDEAPDTYYYPKYVGVRGWVGIELQNISDAILADHLREAWNLVAAPRKRTIRGV